MPVPHVYPPHERPDVEVWVDDPAGEGSGGTWCKAELRMRTQLRDGSYQFNAAWHRDGQAYLDTFPADRVRADTIDRSGGRG